MLNFCEIWRGDIVVISQHHLEHKGRQVATAVGVASGEQNQHHAVGEHQQDKNGQNWPIKKETAALLLYLTHLTHLILYFCECGTDEKGDHSWSISTPKAVRYQYGPLCK